MPYKLGAKDPRRIASWRRYNEAHLEDIRAYYQTERGQQSKRRQSVRQREIAPTKVAARSAVNHAVRDGRLTRHPCEICGHRPSQAHHPFGYEPPMDMAVWWLCAEHHRGIHSYDPFRHILPALHDAFRAVDVIGD